MATEESKTYVRRKKRGSAEQDEGIPSFQSLDWEKKDDFNSEDEAAKRLFTLELDVAEALAELWRMAREPSQQGIADAHLRWSCKRIRTSSLFKKDPITPCKLKEEPEDAVSFAKNRSSCISDRDSLFSDREEIESTRISKDFSECHLRAESPSSPLPSLQLPHGGFLPRGNPTAKSAFQRVPPRALLQRPYLLPVKSEIENVQLYSNDVNCRNASVRRKPRSPINPRGWSGTVSLEGSGAKFELYSTSDSVVLRKGKPAFSEKEKETRKLLRIQANRESARQTIRRKQGVSDDLMKKASSLAIENEGMKQKRELLMQKLFYLRGENHRFKQQLEMKASGNLGLASAELPLMTLSESVSVPAFQISGLPYAGFPVHALTWAKAATQATAPNQVHTFYNNEKPLDAVNTDSFVLQHQAAAMALEEMPSCMDVPASRTVEQSPSHTPVSRTVEQSPSHVLNGVCSRASMQRLSQEETGCTKLECVESCIPQSEGAPCDPSSNTTITDLGVTDVVLEESACIPANSSSSQVSSPTTCNRSQACLNTMPEIAVALDGTKGYNKHAQITQGVRCYDDGTGGHILNVDSLANVFRGRNHFVAVAAAEARKRRKELTRQKFSRSRARRRIIIADNTKES